jgi:hypothetical protein
MSTSLDLQRVDVYLDCLGKEFELHSNTTSTKSSSSSRFNIYLWNHKGEFELMGLDIEGYKEKGLYLYHWKYSAELL